MRTILSHSSVPHSFWPHALDHATYLLNILPTKVLNNYTPTFCLYNRHPSYDHLRVFGCLCYPLLPSPTIHKLSDRSTPCVFLGYPSNHRGYKCYNIKTKQIQISRDVVFDENIFPFATQKPTNSSYDFLTSTPYPFYWTYSTSPTDNQTTPPTDPVASGPTTPTPSSLNPPTSPSSLHPITDPSSHYPNAAQQQPPPPTPPPHTRTMTTRSMSGIFKPKHHFNLHTSTPPLISPLPKSPTDALSNPDWKMP